MRTRTPFLLAPLLALGPACTTLGAPVPDILPKSGWRLVGAYDATALVAHRKALEGEAAALIPGYVWTAAPGLSQSCGPAKAPDGLGVFEAEALANQLSPMLAIMLERTEVAPAGPLRPEDVQVSLGEDGPEFRLYPMVQPRTLSVRIAGDGQVRYKQLVRTQLEMELCMEHKTGRGWIGGSGDGLRQAFLLDPPDIGGADRKFFGGQRDPVPALLGPPDACLQKTEELEAGRSGGGQGEGSLDLVPSDVWGAGLRWCAIEEVDKGSAAGAPRAVPLRLGELEGEAAAAPPRAWKGLDVLVGPGNEERDVRVEVTYGDEVLLEDHALFTFSDAAEAGKEPPGLTDLLAEVPYDYPSLGPADDPDRYALLLVPNWQVVEGLRRGFAERGEEPMPDGGQGIQDGVGWVLEHPELLMVQVPMIGEETSEEWLNLSAAMGGGSLGLRKWGYTVGMLSGRKPIALPGYDTPSWAQVASAQRAPHFGYFVGAFAVLITMVFGGLRRLADLWTRVPTERVAYWPGPVSEDEGEGEAPEAPGGGGEEK